MALPDSIAIEVFRSAFAAPFLRRCRRWSMMASACHQHCRSVIHSHWQDDDSLPIDFDTPEIRLEKKMELKSFVMRIRIVSFVFLFRFLLAEVYVKCCTRTTSWPARCNEFRGYPCNWMPFRWRPTRRPNSKGVSHGGERPELWYVRIQRRLVERVILTPIRM